MDDHQTKRELTPEEREEWLKAGDVADRIWDEMRENGETRRRSAYDRNAQNRSFIY